MADYPKEPSGIGDRGLLESALNRPVNAAHYEGADEHIQAATLLWGLIRSHPFVQGNKRTATVITFFFLERAGYRVTAPQDAIVELVYAIEDGTASIDDASAWFREYVVSG